LTAAAPLEIRLQERERLPRAGETALLPPLSAPRADGVEFPPVAPNVAEWAIASIHDLHRALADANADPLWWYLPLAEWQPFMSALPQAIELEARITTLARQSSRTSYVMTTVDPTVARYLSDRFRGGAMVSIRSDFLDRVIWRLRGIKTVPLRWVNGLAWLRENLRMAGNGPSGRGIPANLDSLLISRLEAGSSTIPAHHWKDRYLGELPYLVQHRTGSAALLLRAAGNSAAQARRVAAFSDFPVIVLGSLLRARDIVSILFRSLRFRLRLGGAEPVLARAARREARSHVRAIADWLLIEVATERLLAICNPRQIICMQENSGWEQAVVHAAQRVRPRAVTVGIFHCPVMPSAFRYRTRADVRDRRPLFHTTVSLGPAHAVALRRLGDWGPLLASTGYAFRSPQLDACLALDAGPSDRPFKLLVVLGGAFDNVAFLRWIAAALEALHDIVIEIKPHPAYDPQPVLRAAGIAVEDGRFRLSKSEAMDRVLSDADVLIYKGSTVAFAGLAAGVPVIHVGDGGLASDDALFASDGLSVSVATPEQLVAEIVRLRQQRPEQREAWAARARDYLRSYYDVSVPAREAVLTQCFPRSRSNWNSAEESASE
jgi:hypothetical protein